MVVVLLASVAAGLALGGRPGGVALRSPALLGAALLVQLLGALAGRVVAPVGLAGSAALVGVFLLRNRGLRGTGLVALGLLANALVVGANGAMPVSADAAARAGAAVPVGDGRHETAGPGTRLRLLADLVPVPLPLRPEVVSAGDVAVAAGLGELVLVALLAGRAPVGGARVQLTGRRARVPR